MWDGKNPCLIIFEDRNSMNEFKETLIGIRLNGNSESVYYDNSMPFS